MEKMGVKEMGEAIEGFMLLSLIMMELGHDGFQMKDFSELWEKLMNDEAVKEKMRLAWEDIGKAKGEAQDLSVEEVFELIMQRMLPYVPKMIAIFRKESK